MPAEAEKPSVFRPGGLTYVRIPTPHPREAAAFYRDVFGWTLHGDPDEPGFDDATGHLIGHFVSDLSVAGDAGFRPYVYVDDLEATLDAVVAHGGEVVTPPYPEGDLSIAVLRDPAGNILGAWQRT